MNRTTLTTIVITGIACCAGLVAQASKNRSLGNQIEEEREAIAGLQRELRQIEPLTSLGASRRPGAHAMNPDGEAAAGSQASARSAENISRSLKGIDQLLAGQGDFNSSPMEFFKVIPDILRVIQHLSVAEMIEVAEGIDAPRGMDNPSNKAITRLVLMLLAAEQDPVRVMQNSELMADPETRQKLFSQLAKRDPKAAHEWVKNSDMTDHEKENFEEILVIHALRNDVSAGLELVRELRDTPGKRRNFNDVTTMALPAKALPDLVQAYRKPSNSEMRGELATMILLTGGVEGGIAASREAAAQIEISPEELRNCFEHHFHELIVAEPVAALEWMEEAQDEKEQERTIPNAIVTWADADFNAAGAYLGKMGPSKTRDLSIKQFAQTVTQVDPEAAAEWSLQIADETLRKQAIDAVTAQWGSRDKQAAEAWLKANGQP